MGEETKTSDLVGAFMCHVQTCIHSDPLVLLIIYCLLLVSAWRSISATWWTRVTTVLFRLLGSTRGRRSLRVDGQFQFQASFRPRSVLHLNCSLCL